MIYAVEISALATRQIKKLPQETQKQVLAQLAVLAEQPRPEGVTKLKGEENTYRVKVKTYRIVYEIFDTQLVVLVVRVAHRREVYRKN